MTYKGARHGYIFTDDDEAHIDYMQQYRFKMKKKAIASTKQSIKSNTEYFNENEKLKTDYIPHTDDGFKTYKRTALLEIDTVGKIKLPWER